MGAKKRIDLIKELVSQGVLGSELCPTETYWHWPILKPELLPQRFQYDAEVYGEIRWFGVDS